MQILSNNINSKTIKHEVSDSVNNKFQIFKNLALVTQIGLIFVISILFSIYLGNIIDGVLNTNNIFKIIFILIGVISGFVSVYKIIMKSIEK